MRTLIYSDEDLEFYMHRQLDTGLDYISLILKWFSPSVLKKGIKVLGSIKANHPTPIYSVVETKKGEKLNRMCGFKKAPFDLTFENKTLKVMEL